MDLEQSACVRYTVDMMFETKPQETHSITKQNPSIGLAANKNTQYYIIHGRGNHFNYVSKMSVLPELNIRFIAHSGESKEYALFMSVYFVLGFNLFVSHVLRSYVTMTIIQ